MTDDVAFIAAMVGQLLPAGHATVDETARLRELAKPYMDDRTKLPKEKP